LAIATSSGTVLAGKEGRVDHQDLVALRHHADGREVFHRVVVDLAQVRRHGHVGDKAQRQRVAVGLGVRHQLGAQVAAGAGLVVDIDLLAQRDGKALRHQPAQRVVAAAGRVGDDEAYRFVGVVLRRGVRRVGCQCDKARQERAPKKRGRKFFMAVSMQVKKMKKSVKNA
jgi:hypothetical protein